MGDPVIGEASGDAGDPLPAVGDPARVDAGVASGDPVPGLRIGDSVSATGVATVGAAGVTSGTVGFRMDARGVAMGWIP